jgi:hypothetical protein
MEKSIAFPYQRSTNTHIVSQVDLCRVLEFLEQKYRLIESRSESSNSVKDYQAVDKKFRTNVRRTSIPVVIYAIGLAVVYFAELFSLLRLLNNIGFAIIGIYFALLAYLYIKFFRAKKELIKEFEMPYYMQNLEFSKVDLLEIKDQLTPENITQFGYECIGKDKNFKVLDQIEKDNILNSVNANDLKKIYTNSPEPAEEKDEEVSVQKNAYDNKYLSFLED